MTGSPEIITATYTFELLPQTEGQILAGIDFSFPESLERFEVMLPSTATVVKTSEFDNTSERAVSWSGGERIASLQFEHEVGGSTTRFGGFSFSDEGGWALAQKPTPTWQYAASGNAVRVVEELETQENVVASRDGNVVYIGPSSENRFFGSQQLFRLVRPESAALSASHTAIRESLSRASADFVVGSRSDEVVAIAAPTNGLGWGSAGLQSGISGFWTKDNQTVDTAHNTWVHEYVHTRQDFTTTESTRWLIEGTANYFAALLTYRQCLVTFDEFYSVVSTDKDTRAVLAEPDRWPSPYTDYKKGMRVLAALDIEIREATDGARTVESVLWELNQTDRSVTHPRLRSIVADVAVDRLANWVDRYARSTAVPAVPRTPDLYERREAVPVDGRQPICPRCYTDGGTKHCSTCGTTLRQRCSMCTSPITGVRDQCPFCGSET